MRKTLAARHRRFKQELFSPLSFAARRRDEVAIKFVVELPQYSHECGAVNITEAAIAFHEIGPAAYRLDCGVERRNTGRREL